MLLYQVILMCYGQSAVVIESTDKWSMTRYAEELMDNNKLCKVSVKGDWEKKENE